MKLTSEQSEKIKQYLPVNYVQDILDKLEHTISESMVRKIVNGTVEDNHGVIELATELAKAEKERAEKIKKQLNQL